MFTTRELEEIKTALLLSQTKTLEYGFVDEEVQEILDTISSALQKVEKELS